MALILLAFIALSSNARADDDTWTDIPTASSHPPSVAEWSGPGSTINRIIQTKRGALFEVGSEGTILESQDGGVSWTCRPSGTTERLITVASADGGSTIVAFGADGRILRSDDGGITWRTVPQRAPFAVAAVVTLSDGRTLVAAGDDGHTLHSDDGGQTWRVGPDAGRYSVYGMSVLPDGRTIVGVGASDSILRSLDGGATWQPEQSYGSDKLIDVTVLPDGQTLIAVGEKDTVLRSSDGGRTWEQPISGGFQTLSSVKALSDGNSLIAVGDHGLVSKSVDKGRTWTDQPVGTGEALKALLPLADGMTLIAAGANGIKLRSTDAGQSWVADPGGTGLGLERIVALGEGGQTLVAIGENGVIVSSDDAGRTWRKRHTGTSQALFGVTPLPGGRTILAYGNGVLLRSEDGGQHWQQRLTEKLLFDIAALGDGTLIAVGQTGTIQASSDVGRTWRPIRSGISQDLASLATLSDGRTLVAVGSNGIVLRSPNGGKNWETATSGLSENLWKVISLGNGQTLVAVGVGGAISRSEDAGQKWRPVDTGDYTDLHGLAGLPDGRTLFTVSTKGIVRVSHTTGLSWQARNTTTIPSLVSAVTLPDGVSLVAVGMNGVIERSSDAGHTWSMTASGTTLNLAALAMLPDGGTLVTVGEYGTILRSEDAGSHWQLVKRVIEADLRAVIVLRDGRTMLAVGRNGNTLRSQDGGRTWQVLPVGTRQDLNVVTSLADDNTVAIGGTAGLFTSHDRGTTWQESVGPKYSFTSLATAPDGHTLVTGNITDILASEDEGASWQVAAMPTDLPILFGPTGNLLSINSIRVWPDRRTMLAVGDGATILRSDDGGRNWATQIVHASVSLFGSAVASGSPVVVGAGGVVQPATSLRLAAAADQVRFQHQGETLTVAWRYRPGVQPSCTRAFYDVDGAAQPETPLKSAITALPQHDGRAGFSLTWSPRAALSPERGTGFRYAIECTDNDLGVTWRQQLPGVQQYLPQASMAWDAWSAYLKLPPVIQVLLPVLFLLAIWVGMLLTMLALAPAWLVGFHERLPGPGSLDGVAALAEKHPVGLAASIARSIGVAALLRLGTHPRGLDAWVLGNASRARRAFDQLKAVGERQLVFDLPARIDGTLHESPWATLDGLFRQSSIALLVTGPGGAGKTTLACQIGRRMLSDTQAPLGGHLCIPLFVDRDLRATETGDSFLAFLTGMLRAMVGVGRLSTALAEALLRSGRVVVIVDGLSERNAATNEAFDPGRNGFPVMRMVVTSRDATRGNMNAVLETLEISPDQLYGFLERYVNVIRAGDGRAKLEQAEIYEACVGLKRLLNKNPTTPLLAGLWAEEVARGTPAEQRPIRGVAELFDSYIDRLLSPADDSPIRREDLRLDLAAIARRELLDNFLPGWVGRSNVFAALRDRQFDNPERRFATLLNSHLVETDARNTEWVHIALDPIAEHLVARHYVQILAASLTAWNDFLDELDRAGRPAGFLNALGTCLEHGVYGGQVPAAVRARILGFGSSPPNATTELVPTQSPAMIADDGSGVKRDVLGRQVSI